MRRGEALARRTPKVPGAAGAERTKHPERQYFCGRLWLAPTDAVKTVQGGRPAVLLPDLARLWFCAAQESRQELLIFTFLNGKEKKDSIL